VMMVESKLACEVCGKPVSPERQTDGLKTCAPRCQRRYKAWRDPVLRRAGQLLIAAGGPRKVLWNDHALCARLGIVNKAEASVRLEALARQWGLEIAWTKTGIVRFVAKVTPERKARFLLTPEVKP
jgi:hypothetical protein